MQEARFTRHRHLTVPDLTCPKCQELAQEVEAKDQIIRDYAENHSKLVAEVSGANEVARAAGKEVTNLKRKLTQQHNESMLADKIERVIAHWRTHRPKTTKAFDKPTSKAYGIIKNALVLMVDDEAGPVGACCEAIDGLHLAPYQEYDRWFAVDGPKRTLRNGIEYALGDEARIERCRGMARRARNLSLDAKLRAYEASSQVQEAWSRALMDELWGQRPDDTESDSGSQGGGGNV